MTTMTTTITTTSNEDLMAKALMSIDSLAKEDIVRTSAIAMDLAWDKVNVRVNSKEFSDPISAYYTVRHTIGCAIIKKQHNARINNETLARFVSMLEKAKDPQIIQKLEERIESLRNTIAIEDGLMQAYMRTQRKTIAYVYKDFLTEEIFKAYEEKFRNPQKWHDALEEWFLAHGVAMTEELYETLDRAIGVQAGSYRDVACGVNVKQIKEHPFGDLLMCILMDLCIAKGAFKKRAMYETLGTCRVFMSEFKGYIAVKACTENSTKAELMEALDAMSVSYKKNAKKDELYSLYKKSVENLGAKVALY